MTELDALADEVNTSGRTLRRAMNRGMIRCGRPSARTLELPVLERMYIRRHWEQLHALVQALRTQPNVRLAVLYGSFARGEEGPDSDLDLLVLLRDDSYLTRGVLRERLEEVAGRPVQLVSLDQAEAAPLLLADVLRDGRVLVERSGAWSRLKGREAEITRGARDEDDRLEREAWAVAALLAERG